MIHPDQPITSAEYDAFERSAFAKHFADSLLLPEGAPSIVVGLEAKWGQGKTSCINMICEALDKSQKPKPIIIHYAPWLISTLDSLIEGFFIQLASTLGTCSRGMQAKDTAKKVLQFAKMLAPIKLIPGVEPWGSLVEGVLTSVGTATQAGAELANLSLDARKKELQEHLTKLKRPIVVIIDDIDRLPPEQVQTVFQMLKAICDFSRVAYLTAYDPDPVTKALSFGDTYDGKAYLEKLVQIPYPLPRFSLKHRREHLQAQVEQLCEELEIEMSTSEMDLWIALMLDTYFVHILSTPRDIARLLNKIRFTARNTKDEVCFSDVAAFEALELKFPEVSRVIRDAPQRFVQTSPGNSEFYPQGVRQQLETRLISREDEGSVFDALLQENTFPEHQKPAVKSLLTFLFPGLHESPIRGLEDLPDLPNRVQHENALMKLLHCGNTSFTYSDIIARNFLSDPSERLQILNGRKEDSDVQDWLGFVKGFLGHYSVEDAEGLARLLMEEDKDPEPEHFLNSKSRYIGNFLIATIRSLSDEEKRISLLRTILTHPCSLSISHRVLLSFLREACIWGEKDYYIHDKTEAEKRRGSQTLSISDSKLYLLKDEWLDNVRKAAREDRLFENEQDVGAILYRWAQLNDNDDSEVKDYIGSRMAESEWMKLFVKVFRAQAGDRPSFIPPGFEEKMEELLAEDETAILLAKAWRKKRDSEE
jgi:predicted KAP-like P-loop ATPase